MRWLLEYVQADNDALNMLIGFAISLKHAWVDKTEINQVKRLVNRWKHEFDEAQVALHHLFRKLPELRDCDYAFQDYAVPDYHSDDS